MATGIQAPVSGGAYMETAIRLVKGLQGLTVKDILRLKRAISKMSGEFQHIKCNPGKPNSLNYPRKRC